MDIGALISIFLSLIVLFFIIWDHLKDDRILAKQVQEFYGDIETFIFSRLQIKYYSALEANEDR